MIHHTRVLPLFILVSTSLVLSQHGVCYDHHPDPRQPAHLIDAVSVSDLTIQNLIVESVDVKLDGRWQESNLDFSVVPLADIPAVLVNAEYKSSREVQFHGMRISLDLKSLVQMADDWIIFGEDFNALRQGVLIPFNQMAEQVEACWLTCLHSPGSKLTLIVAAGTAIKWPTWFQWTRSEDGQPLLTVRYGGETASESIQLPGNSKVNFDPLVIGLWKDIPPQDAMVRLARFIGDKMDRESPPRRPDMGWCSWMYHGGRVSAQDIQIAAQSMMENLYESGYNLVQVDGGWWNDRGLWNPNENFDQGMEVLAGQVHSKNLKFGIHYSPFRINATSPLVKEHPDWFLREIENGKLLSEFGKGKFHMLDGSHPAVLDYTRNTIKRLVNDAGVDYLKLDFLYHGAAEAIRHDPGMTGLEAFSNVMKVIRETVPPETIILGCNLPGFAAAGYVDSVRVGPDINKIGLGHVGPNGEFANMKWGNIQADLAIEHQNLLAQAQAVARQFYTHNKLWINDADAVMVTPDYSINEARAHMTMVALTGGSLFIGDRLDTLPDERLAVLKNENVLYLWRQGRHALPVDLFCGDPVPSVWKVEQQNSSVFGIFNWTETSLNRSWSLDELWMDSSCNYVVRDLWTSEQWKIENGRLNIVQPPHTVNLLELSAE